jgi:hypothetical protein
MHRLATRDRQRPATMHHLHGIHRLAHIKATRLLQRAQIPPPDEPILGRADPDDAALSFVPDEGADRPAARVAVGVVAQDEGLGVGSAEVEESDFLFVPALRSRYSREWGRGDGEEKTYRQEVLRLLLRTERDTPDDMRMRKCIQTFAGICIPDLAAQSRHQPISSYTILRLTLRNLHSP